MQYLVIIELIIELIAKCLENRDRDNIIAGLAKPRLLEVMALRRVLKKEGFKGRDLKVRSKECLDFLCNMAVFEIAEIVSEAEAFNDEG